MNTASPRTPLDSFEKALLAELRETVQSHRHAPAGDTSRRVMGRSWPRRALALAAGGAAAAAVVTTWQLSTPEAPAYAITHRDDRSISFVLNDPAAVEDLEEDLAARGVATDITVLPIGQVCAPGRFEPGAVPANQYAGPDGATIPADLLTPGQTLVIEYSGSPADLKPDGGTIATSLTITDGPVAPCDPTPL